MKIQRSRSSTLILLLFCALPPFSSGLKWFVSPPREESGLTSVNFSKARDQLEQNLSGKVFSETEGGKSANSEGTDRGLGGRREPKQFRLLSNFSDLIQSNSRLAPSDTFCKFFCLVLPNIHPCGEFRNLSKPILTVYVKVNLRVPTKKHFIFWRRPAYLCVEPLQEI